MNKGWILITSELAFVCARELATSNSIASSPFLGLLILFQEIVSMKINQRTRKKVYNAFYSGQCLVYWSRKKDYQNKEPNICLFFSSLGMKPISILI